MAAKSGGRRPAWEGGLPYGRLHTDVGQLEQLRNTGALRQPNLERTQEIQEILLLSVSEHIVELMDHTVSF
jgi:hypothetical protein